MIVELQIFLFMVTGSVLVFLTLRNAKTALTTTKINIYVISVNEVLGNNCAGHYCVEIKYTENSFLHIIAFKH
jgi:hypothetical protein